MRWRYHLLATTFAYSHLAQKQQHYMGITEQLRNHEKFIYSVRNVRVYRSRSLFVSLAHMCFPHIYVFMHVCVSTPPLWVYPISTWHIQSEPGVCFLYILSGQFILCSWKYYQHRVPMQCKVHSNRWNCMFVLFAWHIQRKHGGRRMRSESC